MRRLGTALLAGALVLVPSSASAEGLLDQVAACVAVGTTPKPAPPAAPTVTSVVAISVDGLSPDAIRRLGAKGAPTFYRLLDEGAGTLDARTEVEQTVTMPNHTGMLTGRRVDKKNGGHGVTFDDEGPKNGTVQSAAGHDVASVFDVVHAAGRSTGLFSSKTKFRLYQRSWGSSIDRFEIDTNSDRLARAATADLVANRRAFTFLHLSEPDLTGHAKGWMSAAYVDAVRRTDAELAGLLAAIDADPDLRAHTVVVLTADHGGLPGKKTHTPADRAADYTVPFVAWGAGVPQGDLYALDRDYRDPGSGRPGYDGAQPVRNGDLANLSTMLLGLGPVPGSELDAKQDLDFR